MKYTSERGRNRYVTLGNGWIARNEGKDIPIERGRIRLSVGTASGYDMRTVGGGGTGSVVALLNVVTVSPNDLGEIDFEISLGKEDAEALAADLIDRVNYRSNEEATAT